MCDFFKRPRPRLESVTVNLTPEMLSRVNEYRGTSWNRVCREAIEKKLAELDAKYEETGRRYEQVSGALI